VHKYVNGKISVGQQRQITKCGPMNAPGFAQNSRGCTMGFAYLKQIAQEWQCATIYSFSLLKTVSQESAWRNIL
jgi:hypothetical protein